MTTFAENKKAYYNYEILEKFEAGLVLLGQEVKSIRLGKMDLRGSYVVFKDNEPYLIGAKIPPYQPKNIIGQYETERNRKLLLSKKEIDYLIGKFNQKGLTLIPLRAYNKKGIIKLEFGVGRGKKKYDKKETIKKRETEREIKQEMRRR